MDDKMTAPSAAITAETLMTVKIHCVTPEMKISEAIGLLLTHRIHGAPVVDSLKKVISEINEADLLKLATKGLNRTVGACLESLPTLKQLDTFKRHTPFAQIYREFLTKDLNRIFIIDDIDRLQGLISRSDILRVLYRPDPASVVQSSAPVDAKKKIS